MLTVLNVLKEKEFIFTYLFLMIKNTIIHFRNNKNCRFLIISSFNIDPESTLDLALTLDVPFKCFYCLVTGKDPE